MKVLVHCDFCNGIHHITQVDRYYITKAAKLVLHSSPDNLRLNHKIPYFVTEEKICKSAETYIPVTENKIVKFVYPCINKDKIKYYDALKTNERYFTWGYIQEYEGYYELLDLEEINSGDYIYYLKSYVRAYKNLLNIECV